MDERRVFSSEVRKLIQALAAGVRPSDLEGPPDAIRVAAGFHFLHAGLMQHFAASAASEWGAHEVNGLLEALFSGSGHPIWRFLDGVRTDARPSPDIADRHKRAVVLGFVQALRTSRQSKSMPWAAAQDALARGGVNVSRDAMKGWSARHHQSEQEIVDLIEAEILSAAEHYSLPVERVGIERVKILWRVP